MTDVLIVLGPLLIVLLVAWFCYERQADIYEEMIRRVEAERDEAKHESRVFRGLLFPAIAKADAAPKEDPYIMEEMKATIAAMSTGKPAAKAAKRSRLPFRIRFNQARKLTNTPQRKTDALASALEKQSQEKKSNVST